MPNPWTDDQGKNDYWRRGVILIVIFGILSFLLLTSIVRTIITNPGTIPDDKEWDMQSDAFTDSAISDSQSDEEKHSQE
jgi:hypothetical protein